MKLEPTPYFISNVVNLKDSVNDFLQQRNGEEFKQDENASQRNKIQGGILSDIRYSWLSKGPKLEVLHTKSGCKVAAWCFGAVLHDFETSVTCVAELPCAQGKLPLLVVGLECEITGGMICIFDVSSSRVIRAIQIDDRVTSVHVVDVGGDSGLPGALRALDGVLAVGTDKGKILLLDLCRQACDEAITSSGLDRARDEINACHLINLSFHDLKNLENHKEVSLNSGDHLCIQLNELSTSGVHFALHGPDGEVRLHASMEEVAISALHFCPQLGSLLVGYNFGAFQLFNLLLVRLEYTSPVYEDCIPITHFAIQEPCDDPRAFCYIWAVYNTLENVSEGFPMSVMYALAYTTKDFLEGYGPLYQDFISCSVRFQMELSSIPGFELSKKNCVGSKCLSLRSYTKSVTNRPCASPHDGPEEKISICALIWTVWNREVYNNSETYLTIFDLNQWYKEQMPSATRLDEDATSYLTCVSLSELLGAKLDQSLMDVRIDPTSVNPFISMQRLEEHYYPCSLAFKAVCVREKDIVWFGCSGVQRFLLEQMEEAGPLCLLRPGELFQRCGALGMHPLFMDVGSGANTPVATQRDTVLNIALEHQLTHFLCSCARSWLNGSSSAGGCTLDYLLDWAWRRANTLKFQADKLCVPLFDHSGLCLDGNGLRMLNNCACQLKILGVLFEGACSWSRGVLGEQDLEDINFQHRSLQMTSVYLEVLQWLLNVGLLPECPLSMYPRPDELERISAPYPFESLERFYKSRRVELFELDSSENETQDSRLGAGEGGEALKSCEMLFIDRLIELDFGGSTLQKQWQCDGGTGLYPPPSLQALLRAYLIEDIDIVHKHCLFIYVFLDLAMTLNQSRYKPIITHLIKFPAVFKLSPSIIKITQAFWQLDHGDFSTAMTQLLDPSINNEDLKPWHHRIVLKSLLMQGQHQHALLYQQVRKPPVSSVQDICIVITLLIVNDLLQEAFHFQRQNRSNFNEKDILNHFFTVCDKMKQLPSVLHLPLCPKEETEFITYLKSNAGENNKSFLVIYYLQRDRYGEAFQTNDFLNNNEISQQGLLGQQERNFRNVIVAGFKKTLPEVTQHLLEYCKRQKDKERIIISKASRPVPMSVFVHESNEQAKYKSTLIQASFQKAKETWSRLETPQKWTQLEETPFLSTPKVFPLNLQRDDSTIIYPSVMQPDSNKFQTASDEDCTPAKRLKLNPRQSINDSITRLDQSKRRTSMNSSISLHGTPIVKRKSYRSISSQHVNDQFEPCRIGTPPSILKVRSFIRNSVSPDISLRETSTTPEVLDESKNDDCVPLEDSTAQIVKPLALEISQRQPRRSPFGVSPRRPIQRTPRFGVHFEDAVRPQSRSSNGSDDTSMQVEVKIDVHREQTPEKQSESLTTDSKNSSRSTDDVFYSPNNSFSDQKSADISAVIDPQPTEDLAAEKPEEIQQIEEPRRSALKRKSNDSNTSIRSRRSYKTTTFKEDLNKTPLPAEELPSAKKPEIVPKLGGRRSLTRQVLEQNMFAKTLSSPRMQTRLSISKELSSADRKSIGLEVSYSKSITSTIKTTTDDKIEETCDKNSIETKNVFTTEHDELSSAQIIKHIHNESSSKSSTKKVTEIVDKSDEEPEKNSRPKHILSFSSDVDESIVEKFYKDQPIEEKRRLSTLSLSSTKSSEIDNKSEEINESLPVQDYHYEESQENKKDETVFEDISSIVDDDSYESSSSEDSSIEEKDSSEDSKQSNKEEAIADVEPQVIQSGDDSPEMNEEINDSCDESSEAEKTSDQNDDDDEEESESDDNSCQSSDVIEIQSSSEEESLEELKINQSETPEDFGEEENVDELGTDGDITIEKRIDDNQQIDELHIEMEPNLGPLEESSHEMQEDIEDISDNDDVLEVDEVEEDIEEVVDEAVQEVVDLQAEVEQDIDDAVQEVEEVVDLQTEVEQDIDEAVQEVVDLQVEVEQDIDDAVQEVEEVVDLQIEVEQDIDEAVEKIADVQTEIAQDIDEVVEEVEEIVDLQTELEQNIDQVKQNVAEVKQELVPVVEEIEVEQNVDQLVDTPIELEQNIDAIEEITADEKEENVQLAVEQTVEGNNDEIEQHTKESSENLQESIPTDILETMSFSQAEPVEDQLCKTDILSQDLNEFETQSHDSAASEASTILYSESGNKTPARRSTRSASLKSENSTMRKTRSNSVDSDLKPGKKIPKRRQTSDSTDECRRSTRASSVVNLPVIEENKPLRRSRRASSVDVEKSSGLEEVKASPARRGRKRSIQEDTIEEETEKKSTLSDIPEKMEEYSATHRLTRRQKMIMEKSLELQELRKNQTDLTDLDPINLLDKESFSGSPDKDEHHLRGASPASSVSTQSSLATTPKRKRGRPAAASSTTKEAPITPEKKSPGRPARRKSFTLAQQAIVVASPRTRRSSRAGSVDPEQDVEESDVSSVRSVPVVELQRLSERRMLRHRSLSPTALLEESSVASPRSKRKSTRGSILPLKTDLSKINEEKSPITSSSTSVQEPSVSEEVKPKRGRPRKSESQGGAQSETNLESGKRRTTPYKRLEEYLPQHVAFKTRKSFKISKFVRKPQPE